MNIYANKHHMVRCKNITEGYPNDAAIAKKHLIVANKYTVHHTDVNQSSTDVYLMEFPNVCFNSVFFSDVEEQTKAEDVIHKDYYKYNEKPKAAFLIVKKFEITVNETEKDYSIDVKAENFTSRELYGVLSIELEKLKNQIVKQ